MEFPVSSCPRDPDSWREAGVKLNCSRDNYGRILYQCAPNKEKSSLVQFCLKGSLGRIQKGLCVDSLSNGFLGVQKCSQFDYGCPNRSYINNEIYKYPACLEINTDEHCYVANPSCPNISRVQENSTDYFTKINGPTTATALQIATNILTAFGFAILVLGILVGLILFYKYRGHIYQRVSTGKEDGNYFDQNEVLQGKERILSEKPSDVTRNEDENYFDQSELVHVQGKERILSEKPLDVTKNEDENYFDQSALSQGKERILSEKPSDVTKVLLGTEMTLYVKTSDETRKEDDNYFDQSELSQGKEGILSEIPSNVTKDERGKHSDQIEFVDKRLQNHPSNLQMKENVEACNVDCTTEVEKTSIKEKLVIEDLYELSKTLENSSIANIISQSLSNVKEGEVREIKEEIRNQKLKDQIKEIEKVLKNLKDEIENLILKRDRYSANQATAYIDVYSGFAIFRTQLYDIEKRDNSNQVHASTDTIWNYTEETNKTDRKMIESITKSSFEKVVFLTLFNPTKLRYFPQFIRKNGMKFYRLDKEDDFCLKMHLIRSVNWPEWYVKMGWDINGSVWSSKNFGSRPCKFFFKSVEKREIDNIFYIRSMRYPDYYVVLMEGLFKSLICESVEGLPGPEGQWKIIRFINDKNPCYVMSPLSMPCCFMYMTSGPFGHVKGTDDLQEIEKKGIWHIIDADSKS